jgi:hypothetical protein
LPRTTCDYNGVKIQRARYFDSFIPWIEPDNQTWESGIIYEHEKHSKNGDEVIIVGGGRGVTAVNAARKVGPSGKVTVYEGSKEHTDYVRQSAKINELEDRINVIHGIVGPMISLNGEAKEPDQISPEELPRCDLLELDCEGSEVEILQNLSIRPRDILVESHGMYDAPASKLEDLLRDLSYSVISKSIADEGIQDFCIENDVYVISATRN